MSDVCYHYTVGPKISLIEASGKLLPSEVGLLPGEKPVLWFSTNPSWEPTATKMLMGPIGPYLPEVDELHYLCGLFRYGYRTEGLIPWPELAVAANIPSKMVWQLISEGNRQGADPSHWLGSLASIELSQVSFEQWDGRAWRPSSIGGTGAKPLRQALA